MPAFTNPERVEYYLETNPQKARQWLQNNLTAQQVVTIEAAIAPSISEKVNTLEAAQRRLTAMGMGDVADLLDDDIAGLQT